MTKIPNTSGKAFINKPEVKQQVVYKIPSINDGPVFKPQMTKPIAMEDIQSIITQLASYMSDKSFDFKSTEDNDKFFTSLQLFLEETFNYPDFRNKQQG